MQILCLLEAQAQLLITGLLNSLCLLYVPFQSNSQCFGVFLGNQLRQEEEALRTTTSARLTCRSHGFFRGVKLGDTRLSCPCRNARSPSCYTVTGLLLPNTNGKGSLESLPGAATESSPTGNLAKFKSIQLPSLLVTMGR